MDLQQIKYHTCSLDHELGVLLVDIETETLPEKDPEGNNQYYCLGGKHIFSVEDEAEEERASSS